MERKTYIVSGFDKQFYCKTAKIYGSNKNVSYTFSFGEKSVYCVVIAIKDETSDEAYIDRIEHDSACVKDGTLKLSIVTGGDEESMMGYYSS